MTVEQMPPEIKTAIAGLLKPYGIDFADLTPVTTQKYMTPKQASVYCGLTAKTIRDKALNGEIASIRIGNSERSRVLIVKSDLDNWLESFSSRKKQKMA